MKRQSPKIISKERENQIWSLLEAERKEALSPRSLTPLNFVHLLRQNDLEPTYKDLWWLLLMQNQGAFYPSDELISFMRRLCSDRTIRSILAPADWMETAVYGMLPATDAERITSLIADPSAYDALEALSQNDTITRELLSQDDILNRLAAHNETYDLVVAFPPIAGKARKRLDGDQLGLQTYEEWGHVLLANAALKISDTGLGLFTVTDRFFFDERSQIREALATHGLSVNAVFSLPPLSFAKTAVAINLILISHTHIDRYFVAELSDSDKRNRGIYSLYKKGEEAGNDPTMGRLVDPESFTGVRALMVQERAKQHALEIGLTKQYTLNDLAVARIELIDNRKKFSLAENVIYIPQRPGPVHSAPGDLTANKYYRVVLDPKLANAEYVARLLNTSLGKSMLDGHRTGTTIPNLRLSAVRDVTIYLPLISVQRDIAEVDIEVETMITGLTELRDELWLTMQADSEPARKIREILGTTADQRERFEDWIDTLPFPLASILWVYHVHTNDPFKQYRLLQRFFEGMTQFMATVLLSGAYLDEEWLNRRSRLFTDRGGVRSAGFGTWKAITEALTADLQTYIKPNENNLTEDIIASRTKMEWYFSTRDDLLIELFPQELIEIMAQTNALRNQWRGHGGLDDVVGAERLVQLVGHLNTTRSILGRRWQEYRLIQPISSRMVSGTVSQDVRLLMGHRNPFVIETIELDEQLDNAFLYLHTPGQSRALKVQPLMRVLERAIGDQNASYFYSRVLYDRDVVFVSHHYETEPDIKERFKETLTLLRNLDQLVQDYEG